jgi:Pyridine nucleotide-disulphide oxidoreductase
LLRFVQNSSYLSISNPTISSLSPNKLLDSGIINFTVSAYPSHRQYLIHVSSSSTPITSSPLVQNRSSLPSILPRVLPKMSVFRHLFRSRFNLSQTKQTRFFTTSGLASLLPTEKGKDKPRVVVLGTGWAGCRLMKGIDTSLYDVVCVSPRNHMVFTPLLASTCVGTLEFRSVAEPVSSIQPAISRLPGSYFFLSRCTGVNTDAHTVCAFFPGVYMFFHGLKWSNATKPKLFFFLCANCCPHLWFCQSSTFNFLFRLV